LSPMRVVSAGTIHHAPMDAEGMMSVPGPMPFAALR
jgi:hypothetical protein